MEESDLPGKSLLASEGGGLKPFSFRFICDKLAKLPHSDVTRSSYELVTSKIEVDFSAGSSSLRCIYLVSFGSLHHNTNATPHSL